MKETTIRYSRPGTRAARAVFLLAFFSILTLGCQQRSPAGVAPSSSASSAVDPSQVCCGGDQDPQGEDSSSLGIESVSMGTLDQGDIFEHTFSITNESPQTLHPAEVEYSYPCCVTPTLNFTSLAPGQKGELKVRFDSRFRGGPIDIFVQLPWREQSERQHFHIGGSVRESFKVWPTGLRFSKRGGEVPLVVSGEDLFETFKVLEIVNPFPGSVEVSQAKRSGNTLEYTVTWVGAEDTDQVFDLEVKTDHPKVPTFPVRVASPGAKV